MVGTFRITGVTTKVSEKTGQKAVNAYLVDTSRGARFRAYSRVPLVELEGLRGQIVEAEVTVEDREYNGQYRTSVVLESITAGASAG